LHLRGVVATFVGAVEVEVGHGLAPRSAREDGRWVQASHGQGARYDALSKANVAEPALGEGVDAGLSRQAAASAERRMSSAARLRLDCTQAAVLKSATRARISARRSCHALRAARISSMAAPIAVDEILAARKAWHERRALI